MITDRADARTRIPPLVYFARFVAEAFKDGVMSEPAFLVVVIELAESLG